MNEVRKFIYKQYDILRLISNIPPLYCSWLVDHQLTDSRNWICGHKCSSWDSRIKTDGFSHHPNNASLDDLPITKLNGNTTTLTIHPDRNQKCQWSNVVLLLFARHCHISGDAAEDVTDSCFHRLGVPWFGLGQAFASTMRPSISSDGHRLLLLTRGSFPLLVLTRHIHAHY